jgi:phosphoribosylformylglycinamidine synthase
MPHPEHNVDALTGPTQDGSAIFRSVFNFLAAKV